MFLKAVVWYWYGHYVKLVERNMVGKVLEIKDALLWRHVTYGQG
jgi:hypothetical protein